MNERHFLAWAWTLLSLQGSDYSMIWLVHPWHKQKWKEDKMGTEKIKQKRTKNCFPHPWKNEKPLAHKITLLSLEDTHAFWKKGPTILLPKRRTTESSFLSDRETPQDLLVITSTSCFIWILIIKELKFRDFFFLNKHF